MTTVQDVSLQNALRALDAAVTRASELGVAVSVAVVDNGGVVKASARMDGVSFLNANLATAKAVTSAGLGLPTAGLGQFLSGEPTLLAGLASHPDITVVPGGVPIFRDGVLLGAVGVAGGQSGEDDPIAAAALEALSEGD